MTFDLVASAFLLTLAYCGNGVQKQFIFVFGIISLYCVSTYLEPRRQFRNLPLMLLLLWSLIGIFIHTHHSNISNLAYQYKNIYILSEGFLFIWMGIMLLDLIVRYSSNLKIYAAVLIVSFLPWIKDMLFYPRATVAWAFLLSLIIYFCIIKKFYRVGVLLLMSCLFFAGNAKWLIMKFVPRVMGWGQLLKEIWKHPFIGTGFSDYMLGHYLWVDADKYGWVYRHNDYFSLAAYVGPISLVFIAWFLLRIFNRIKYKPICILFLLVVIAPFFQSIMFDAYRAGIVLASLGIVIAKEGYNG